MNISLSIRRSSCGLVRARGVASLAVTLLMLALSALVILYANRGQLFEQRTSANQMRATAAFEAAEAGIEWAMARLNDSTLMVPGVASDCGATPVASGTAGAGSFRVHYAAMTQDPNDPALVTYNPPPGARAVCSIEEAPVLNAAPAMLTCRCPTPHPTNAIAHPSPLRRSFEVFIDRTGVADPGMVRIRSVGCRDAVGGPASTTPAPGAQTVCGNPNAVNEGTATITILAKHVPGIGSFARAAFTGAGWAAFCGAFDIQNTSPTAGGILANTGLNIQVGQGTFSSGTVPTPCGGGGGQTMTTIGGTPISSVMFPNDPKLLAAGATSDSMMKTYFGMTLAQYRAVAYEINGATAQDRANNLVAASTAGINPPRMFWINGDMAFSGNVTLGSPNQSIMIASASDMTFNGTTTIWGIVYSDIPDWNHNGTGNMTIQGQLVVRGDHSTNGNGRLIYNDGALRDLIPGSGVFVRVPGSWIDS